VRELTGWEIEEVIMLKIFIRVAAVLIMMPFSAVAALLVLLWMFWEKLGELTLTVYEDYKGTRVIRSFSGVLSIDI
jgi:hypothetical protein